MKKKAIIAFVAVLLPTVILSAISGYAIGKNEVVATLAKHIKITNEGRLIDIGSDTPLIHNNRTYLPVRAISEALGYEIEWFGTSNTANLIKPDHAYPIIAVDGVEIIDASQSINLMSNTVVHSVSVVINQTKTLDSAPILILEILKNGVVIDSQTKELKTTSGKYTEGIKSSQFSHQLGNLNSEERLKKYNEQFSYRLKIK